MSHEIEHGMFDDDPMFIIDEKTRDIVYQGEKIPAIMQYDHLAEIMTFQLPRYMDGHDMMTCNSIRAHFVNISTDGKIKVAGIDEISELSIPEDNGDVVRFCWCVPGDATQLEGKLHFVLSFYCIDVENNIVKYRWNTERNDDLVVLAGIDNSEKWVTSNVDFLNRWKDSVLQDSIEEALSIAKESGEFDGEGVTVSNVEESTVDGGDNVVTFSDGKTLTVKNGKQGSTGKNGNDGKTAYQYAKDGGYPGTEAQFNALLAGFPQTAESWIFVLEDGTEITRQVFIK